MPLRLSVMKRFCLIVHTNAEAIELVERGVVVFDGLMCGFEV